MNARNEYWYSQWLSRSYKWMGTLLPIWDTNYCEDVQQGKLGGQLGKDPQTGKIFTGIYSKETHRFIEVYGIECETI